MKKLHYGSRKQLDVELLEFKTLDELACKISELTFLSKNLVYLFTYETDNEDFYSEIVISEVDNLVMDLLNKEYITEEVNNFFLQEYTSYQDAYDVALMMRETSEICYTMSEEE